MRENDFLSWIASQTPAHSAVPLHVGDDMAAVRLPNDLALLKIDQCLDQVHFDLRKHSVAQAGRKAVNRCLSDCAAMAAVPAAIMISVALPEAADETFARGLFLACRDAAAAFDCPLVGGDTAIWNQRLAITVAALGRKSGPYVTRAGAKAGDALCVSGQLGGSILGRHLSFTPRIELAQRFVQLAPIHAMMDLSDGLAMDLPRLCAASNVGATVDSRLLPIDPDAHRLSQQDHQPAYLHALGDGEDYELLFTVDPSDLSKLSTTTPAITRVGTITSEPRLQILDQAGAAQTWPAAGWEHTTPP